MIIFLSACHVQGSVENIIRKQKIFMAIKNTIAYKEIRNFSHVLDRLHEIHLKIFEHQMIISITCSNITAHFLGCKLKTDVNLTHAMIHTTVWWLTWMTSSPAWIFLHWSAGDCKREIEILITPVHYRDKSDTRHFCVALYYHIYLNLDLSYEECFIKICVFPKVL